MQLKVPDALLLETPLPQLPNLSLYLLDACYPQHKLNQEQVQWLMDDPPYWAFCWASGQVLATYLLENPSFVKNKCVIDFGCGSGVVAIAAKMAGAKRSIAVDIDPIAILATQANAKLNNVVIEVLSNLEDLTPSNEAQCLIAADVFYDAENLKLLAGFLRDYDDLIIADSRVKSEALLGLTKVTEMQSCTLPDLDESMSFNRVRIYRKG